MYNDYLFRASSIGKLMGGIPKPLTANQEKTLADLAAKTRTEKQNITYYSLLDRKNAKCKLNDAAKKFCDQLIWEKQTGRSKNIENRYLDKGINVEEQSITLYSDVMQSLFVKNENRKWNKYFTGECDNADGKIRDIKSSYDITTFPRLVESIKTPLYEWQLDVYMDLWGIKEAELIYCLVDTPFKIIEDDIRRLDWKFNVMDMNGDIRDESIPLIVEKVSNHIYSRKSLEEFCSYSGVIHLDWFEDFIEIPKKERVKVFEHRYQPERIEMLKEMVELAREYMNKAKI